MTPEWIADFMGATDIDQVMMVAGMEPPTMPASELSLWHVLDDGPARSEGTGVGHPGEPDRAVDQQMGEERFRELNRDETYRLAT